MKATLQVSHDALQDGFVAVFLPKNQDKMYVRSVQVTTRIVKRSIFMNCFMSSIYSFLQLKIICIIKVTPEALLPITNLSSQI